MAVTITAVQTSDPGAPQVGITVAGLSVGTGCQVVVSVSWDNGSTWYPVRGGTIVGALGSTFLRDFVPPIGVLATYQAVVTGGSTATVTATVTVTSSYAWIQDPLAPRSAVPLTTVQDGSALFLLATTAASVSRKQQVDYAQVVGSSLPVASHGVRQGPSSVPIGIQALAASQGALVTSLRNLFATAGQLVLRGMPSQVGLDPVAHVSAPDVTESPTVRGIVGIFNAWDLTVTQTRPTTVQVIVPWWTFDQVKTLVGTQLGTALGSNLVSNPGFETNTTGWGAAAGAALSRVTTQHNSGVAACQVVTTSTSGDGINLLVTGETAPGASNTVQGSIFVKATASTVLAFVLEEVTSGGTVVGTTSITFTASGGWDAFSLNDTLAATAGNWSRLAVRTTASLVTTFWVDDAAVQVVPNSFDAVKLAMPGGKTFTNWVANPGVI